MVFLTNINNDNIDVLPIGSDIDDYLDNNQTSVLEVINNNIDKVKLGLERIFANAGINRTSINNKLIYYVISLVMYEKLRVQLDINKDINSEIESTRLLLKKFFQDYVNLLNEKLVTEIDKDTVLFYMYKIIDAKIYGEQVTVKDNCLVTSITDASPELKDAIASDMQQFIDAYRLVKTTLNI